MSKFNFVTLVGKEVEIKLVQGQHHQTFKGRVKQVFDDVVILESEEG